MARCFFFLIKRLMLLLLCLCGCDFEIWECGIWIQLAFYIQIDSLNRFYDILFDKLSEPKYYHAYLNSCSQCPWAVDG